MAGVSFAAHEHPRVLASTLRAATRELAERGLVNATRWLVELLHGLPEPDRAASAASEDQDAQMTGTSSATAGTAPTPFQLSSDSTSTDKHLLAKAYLDSREYKRCASLFDKNADAKTRWVCLYARYLGISSEMSALAVKPADSDGRPPATFDPAHTTALLELSGQLDARDDPFLIYLKGLVLYDLGKREEAIVHLVQSVTIFPYNWSVWTRLAEVLDGEEELIALIPQLPESCMAQMFNIHATLEVHRASEDLRHSIDQLAERFPNSVHLHSQQALVHYHLREFEAAERLFDEIAEVHPMRFEDLDTYSNILYVMGKRGKLSQVAQRYAAIDRNRPETCCLMGNYYSIRGEHAKAVALFRRAIKLDRRYLAAWTLMGHEYVEMSNTHAAIESYRRACDVNSKDYRAWYGLGQAYELLGMQTYSLRYFQRATALRPFDSRMWQALGQCYARLAKPHEVLKCYKRAQLFAEPDDISNLRKLGDQSHSMQLFEQAALYWSRLIETAVAMELPSNEYIEVYALLAAYEMGEYHLSAGQGRVLGDLALAEVYLNRALADKTADSDYAKKLQQKLRALQVE